MSADPSDRPGEPTELNRGEFARLFSRNARRIYGLADLQPGSNFFARANRIAYYEVPILLKQQRRSRPFSDEPLKLLANEAVALPDRATERYQTLDECLSRLDVNGELVVDGAKVSELPVGLRRLVGRQYPYAERSALHWPTPRAGTLQPGTSPGRNYSSFMNLFGPRS